MPNLLISGPAGAGKTQEAAPRCYWRKRCADPGRWLPTSKPCTPLLLGIERLPGRSISTPKRREQDAYALTLLAE